MKQNLVIFGFLLPALLLAGCGQNTSSVSSTSSSILTSIPDSQPDQDGSIKSLATGVATLGARYGGTLSGDELLAAAGLSGKEGSLYQNVFQLLYQEFKDIMPAKTGQRYFSGAPAYKISGIPSNCVDAVNFLIKYGLYTPSNSNKTFEIKTMPADEISTYFDRFCAYFGTNLKDDFYSTLNHDKLFENPDTSKLEPNSNYYRSSVVDSRVIQSWVSDLLKKDPANSYLQSANAFEETLVDETSKNDPTRGIVSAINALISPTTEAAFLTAAESLAAEQYQDPLFQNQSYEALRDSSSRKLFVSLGFTSRTFDTSITDLSDTSKYLLNWKNWVKSLFLGLNFSESKSEELAGGYIDCIRGILTKFKADSSGGSVLLANLKNQTFGTSFNVYTHLVNSGFGDIAAGKENYYYVTNYSWMKATFNTLFGTEATLAMKQAYAAMNEISHYHLSLPLAALKAYEEVDALPSDYFTSNSLFKSYVSAAISSDVAGYYQSQSDYSKSVQLGLNLFKDASSVFSTRISNETWLSSTAIAASQNKLNAIKGCCFGSFSDGTQMEYTSPQYISVASGGSFYQNQVRYDRSIYTQSQADIGLPETFAMVVKEMNPLTANAFYVPGKNAFYVTLGFLASKSSFITMSQEHFLAELGWALCHEMTHGFDTNGINYDETGTWNQSWWPTEDRLVYTSRAEAVADYYDGYEVFPGEPTLGPNVVSEAVADLGGIRLCLDIAKKNASFDYDSFWKDAATNFCAIATRDFYDNKLANDVHPFGRARVNRAFSTFDEFTNTYQLSESDAMYEDPNDRVAIW